MSDAEVRRVEAAYSSIHGDGTKFPESYPRSVLLGVVEVTDCIDISEVTTCTSHALNMKVT